MSLAKREREEDIMPPNIPKFMAFQSNSAMLNNSIFSCDAPKLLSNFALLDVDFNGKIYPSVEHAFQSTKYSYTGKPEFGLLFEKGGSIVTPVDAKRAGGRTGMKKVGATLDITQCNRVKLDVMKSLICSKVERHKVIADILGLARKHGVKLVHTSRSDLEWGAHLNDTKTGIKRGNNLLGELYVIYVFS